MDDAAKFNETSLPETKDFYSHLNMEYTIDANYAHAQRIREFAKILKSKI